MTKRTTLKAVLIGSSCLMAAPIAAHAQNNGPTLDTITVTAQSREKGLQDTPISISAVPSEKIQGTAIQRSEDLQYFVPNLTFTETGISTNIFIRGIGSGINQAFEQSVGTFVDGVNLPRAQQTRAPFLDLERIEVLRGPQAILFGKNAVAGALNITTAKPGDEFGGYLSGSYEFADEEYIIEGAVNVPLTERARMRFAGRYRDADGYVENATLDRTEPNREDWTLRWTGELDLSDSIMARAKVEASEFDVIGRNIEVIGELPAAAGPFTGLTYAQILAGGFAADPSVLNTVQDGIRSSNGDFSNNEIQLYQLDLLGDFGDFEVRSTSAFQNLEYDELCDCDFTGAVVFDAGLQEQYQQFSQEIRVTSPIYDRFDFVGGVYFQTSEHDFEDQINVPANSLLVPAVNASSGPGVGNLIAGTSAARIATTESDFYSAFIQFNFRPTETVELQLGGRLSHEDKEGTRTLSIFDIDLNPLPAAQIGAPLVYASGFGITSTNLGLLAGAGNPAAGALLGLLGDFGANGILEDSISETRFSPDVKLVWTPSDEFLLYASWARGFKSGGFDFRANNRLVSPTLADSFAFGDETATNYEIGGKLAFLDGAAEINFAAFFTKFDDLQISIFDGTLGFNVGNAASSEVYGIEVDGRWAVTEFLTLSGSLAFTDFEFTDFQNGQCFFGATPNVDFDGNGVPELCDYTGNSNQLVSDFQGLLTSDIRVPVLGDYLLANTTDLFYTSEYDASGTFDPALVQDGYATLNSRVSFGPESGAWQIAFLGKNLTDEQFLQFGGDVPLSGSTFGVKSNYAFFSQGRQLWLQARIAY